MIQSTIVASQALAILGLVAACLTVVVGVVLISFNKKQKPLPNKALAFVPAVTGAGACESECVCLFLFAARSSVSVIYS